MFVATEAKPEVCPFTLDLCEECCEQKIIQHQGICSFTLEPCHFQMGDGSHRTKN